MSDFDDGLAPAASLMAELALKPEAARWARECGWVPGTGHCRNRPCSKRCLFRPQRRAEAVRLARWRLQRRRAQRVFASRPIWRVVLLLFVSGAINLS